MSEKGEDRTSESLVMSDPSLCMSLDYVLEYPKIKLGALE